MDVFFDCNKCGRRLSIPPEQAGGAVRCPHCGSVIEAPASHPAPSSPASPPAASAPAPAPVPQAPWAQPPAAPPAAPAAGPGRDRAARYRLLGILTLVGAGLNLLMALGLVFFTVVGLSGGFKEQMRRQGQDVSPEAVTAFYGVMAVLSLVTAAVVLAAGLKMLRGGPGARGWALGSGILLLCSIWTCCPWPLNLALGIYTLVVVLQDRPA